MKIISGKNLEGFVFFLILVSLLSSCVPQKKIKYLQKQQKQDSTTYYKAKRGPNYRIQPSDVLYIKIYTMDEKTFQLFNRIGTSTSQQTSEADLYLNGYTVSDSGYVKLPILGSVFVRDLSLENVQRLLQNLVDEYLKETVVVVKMANYRITILGEVNKPGQYNVYQDRINLFEAVSLANDLTEFANRNKIAIIRKGPDGSQVHYVDMTSDKILNSEFFILQPNDIVYAAPLGIKRWGAATFPWGLVFGAISTALLLINYFER
ncbi:MAG TPA: polysaccharide biosynthesis/export family protein [Bacteroidales bacterium]|nr:polysaccharide biosynthesis/export family protein [Bacteroidales bacterium]